MRHYKIATIILFTLILRPTPSFADFKFTDKATCTEKRIDNVPPLSKIPVYDQTDTEMCWSPVATTLIDCMKLSMNPDSPITSPVSFAFEYSSQNGLNTIANIPILTVLNKAENLSSCPNSIVKSEVNGRSIGDFLGEIEKFYDSRSVNRQQSASGIVSCLVRAGYFDQQAANLNNISNKISSFLEKPNFIQFTWSLFEGLCKGDLKSLKPLPKPKIEKSATIGDLAKSMTTFQNMVNNQLDSKSPKPVGISYCRAALFDRKYRSVEQNGQYNKEKCNDSVHTSPVVGRRPLEYEYVDKADGQKKKGHICQFLVRDSYGKKCNHLPPDPSVKPSIRCENGHIWVDEDVLLRNTGEAFHYEY